MNKIYPLIIGILIGGLVVFFLNPSSNKPKNVEKQEATSEIYTCSMHPQIKNEGPGSCPLCGMDLIPANSTISDNPLVLEMTKSAVKLAQIQTTIIGSDHKENDINAIELTGKIQVDERTTSSQVTHLSGRIEQLFITYTGQKVSKGQKLATIYAPDLIAAQNELLEAKKMTNINPNILDAAKNKLKYWKLSDSQIQNILDQGIIQETFPVFASQTGIVAKKLVSIGDYLKKGQPLFEVINLNKVWVIFDAFESDLSKIKLRSTINFTTPSVPNHTFKTSVSFIDPIINPNTRAASIRAEISNNSGLLKPEMLVHGRILQKNSGNTTLYVPKTAVLWTGKQSVVYVQNQELDIPTFEYKSINLGARNGNTYQVLDGLKEGDAVVTNGAFSIDAAAQLNNQASMMNPSVGIKGQVKAEKNIPNFVDSTPKALKKQLKKIVDTYFELKDAFVATDPKAAQNQAQIFLTVLTVKNQNLKGESMTFWMTQTKNMKAHLELILNNTNVEEQRKQFDFISRLMIENLTAFGLGGTPIYVQHCPMAFDNQGADWLSDETTIKNPYYGNKMLKCGSVIDQF